jgi:hypothetical protein
LPYDFIGRREVLTGTSSSKRKNKPAEKNDLVLTPGGWRPKSKVAKVEPGHHVEVQDGRLKVIHTATGEVVVDLGAIPKTDTKNSKASVSTTGSRRKIKKPTKPKK